MKRTIVELVLDCLVGTGILFVISVLFSGMMLYSVQTLAAAFGACFVMVLVVELLFHLHRIHWDPEQYDDR
ncbi:MAG: hypothetical protein J6J04_04400 [Oscillospiraceae bacterium]|nr:hypothetical protein [Oscillospiraceae bacterium]